MAYDVVIVGSGVEVPDGGPYVADTRGNVASEAVDVLHPHEKHCG